MTLTIVLIWWAFGAGVGATEYQLVLRKFDRPIIYTIIAVLGTCIMGPLSLAFGSYTCLDCGQLVSLKVFGFTIYKNELHE